MSLKLQGSRRPDWKKIRRWAEFWFWVLFTRNLYGILFICLLARIFFPARDMGTILPAIVPPAPLACVFERVHCGNHQGVWFLGTMPVVSVCGWG
jgi:hypothetical protein